MIDCSVIFVPRLTGAQQGSALLTAEQSGLIRSEACGFVRSAAKGLHKTEALIGCIIQYYKRNKIISSSFQEVVSIKVLSTAQS